MRLRRTSTEDPNEALARTTADLWNEAMAAGMPEDKFVEVYLESMDTAVPSLVDRLIHDAPGMLRNRRKMARGFERRLIRRWGQALDLYRATLEVALESGGDFNNDHRPAAAKENDFLFEAVVQLHARACTVASEVFILLSHGFATGAVARWRTLHEISVVANVLVTCGQTTDLAERFLLHDPVERAWDLPAYQEHAAALGYEALTEEEVANTLGVRDDLVSRFGPEFARPNGWAACLFSPERAPKQSELEKLANMSHMLPWYKHTSHAVHADAKGTSSHVVKRGPNTTLVSGATNADLVEPGHGSLISLMQVTTCLLLRTRTDSLGEEPMRLVIAKTLFQLVEKAGDAFLAAHRKLEEDEQKLWEQPTDDPRAVVVGG